MEPYVRQAVKDKRKIIYFRFASHEPFITDVPEVETITIPLSHRFENFTVEIHNAIEKAGRDAFYVFDCLSELQTAWATDLMMGNFFRVLDNVKKVGKTLGNILEEMKAKHPCVGDVRYIGLFAAVELVKDKSTKEPLVPYGSDPQGIMGKLVGMLKQKKFITYSHENMLFVNPPLIITEEQIKEEMLKMDEVLSFVDSEILS